MMTYNITEIFYSLQGEGNFTGTPAIFIRMAGCNLDCHFCFGVKPSRRVPRITLANEKNKKITEVKKDDVLLTYDNEFNVVETIVQDVLEREVTEWYELKINGRLYFVTPEHPFFTTRGMVEAKDLQVNDYVYHLDNNQKLSYFAKHNNNMKNPEVAKKSAINTDYIKSGKKISGTIKKKQEEGTYISTWDLLTKDQQNNTRKKISLKNSGENNGKYIIDYPYRNFSNLKKLCASGEKHICDICNNDIKLEVHHIDENHENDSLDNLICICHKCHSQIHQRGYNFWNGVRKDKKVLQNAVAANGFEVESKKYINLNNNPHFGRHYGPKPLHVYNLSCAPYNTYILDNMWVHNCDTDFKVRLKLDEQQVLDVLEDLTSECRMVIITGGEPTIHDLTGLIKVLQDNEYFVAMETNGTQKPPKELDWVACSPKRGNGFNYYYANELKYVVDDDFKLADVNMNFEGDIYLQPESEKPESLKRAIDYCLEFPKLRLSLQTQKILDIQ